MEFEKLEKMNRIQEILVSLKLSTRFEFPQILVIGSQSVGKSSLLELLMDVDILPKGEGIVTRCPILIQASRKPSLTGLRVTFNHSGDTIFTSPERVKEEIISQTNRIAGIHKNITEEPIILRLESATTHTLSYLDLPGLTKIPVKGQSDNQTRRHRK